MIVLSSVAGGGKSTLIHMIREKHPELAFSVSCTTRPPRPGDKEGVTYFFLTKERFEEGIRNSEFLEWARVHDNYYGTPDRFVRDCLASGRSVIMDLDVQGAKQVKNRLGDGVITVFILPPNEEEWIKRLRGRGTDSEESILKRIRNGKEELSKKDEFDHILVNDNLQNALRDLEKIVF
ncbi:guanylate kinase [Leptospira wolffii]|uniref:guanylate kinase n=1 Tax=Leptospira wolffii TaxID=409998 RepID=UPI001082DD44|nr:guanylate kinase [Leptospira wolffii]TGK60110.1 guanylate kinase [Leptospira wolffii]TGK72453.1 guanylate kinase [Leptospira wolffii]TGK76117.1 guanylate kinase [Leptospira wolffii]TGL30369.1 guanylate kinase [Leptospira wolffii]